MVSLTIPPTLFSNKGTPRSSLLLTYYLSSLCLTFHYLTFFFTLSIEYIYIFFLSDTQVLQVTPIKENSKKIEYNRK